VDAAGDCSRGVSRALLRSPLPDLWPPLPPPADDDDDLSLTLLDVGVYGEGVAAAEDHRRVC